MDDSNKETVISGSFRKHLEKIGEAREKFEMGGVRVLAPGSAEATDPDEQFIVLTSDDPSLPPHKLEMNFLRQIRRASFLYVANIGGYVGQSAATEIAYARLKGIPVLTAEPIGEFSAEVPENLREALQGSIQGVLPIEGISTSAIQDLSNSGSNTPEPLDNDTRVKFEQQVVSLIKELKFPEDN